MQSLRQPETIPYKETRNFVKNVLTYTIIYQQLLGKKNYFTRPHAINYHWKSTAQTSQSNYGIKLTFLILGFIFIFIFIFFIIIL